MIKLKERMSIFSKGSGEDYCNTERCKNEEDRTELLWFKRISATVAVTELELGSDLHPEKENLSQNNFCAATTDSLVIVLGRKAKPRPQPAQARLSLAFNSEESHAEHIISKPSPKH